MVEVQQPEFEVTGGLPTFRRFLKIPRAHHVNNVIRVWPIMLDIRLNFQVRVEALR
jgi:hypothetical protein